jgi:hypothetical protein
MDTGGALTIRATLPAPRHPAALTPRGLAVDDVQFSDEDGEDDDGGESDERPELTEDQLKLLYLISRCDSHVAQ